MLHYFRVLLYGNTNKFIRQHKEILAKEKRILLWTLLCRYGKHPKIGSPFHESSCVPNQGENGKQRDEKLGGGVRSASQNLYPIYDQNLRYSLPCL